LVCVLDVVSFPFKTTVNSVSANTRGTFFETSKSLGLTEIALYFFFMNLSSIKFNYRRSHFLTLLFDLKFMLLIDILNIDFFVFIGTLFIMRETGISWFERGFLNLDFFQVFEVVLLFFYLFGNVSEGHIILSQWYLTWN
jgi:hypothetical protein